MIYLEEIDIVRRRFTDFGITLAEMSAKKRELEEETIKSLKDGFGSVLEVLNDESVKAVSDVSNLYLSYVKDLQSKMSQQNIAMSSAFTGVSDVFSKVKEDFAKLIENMESGGVGGVEDETKSGPISKKYAKQPKKAGGGYLAKEIRSTKSIFKGWMGKLKIPQVGSVLAGGIMLMAYGYFEEKRIQAEAGEIKNILVASFGGALDSALNKATRTFSVLQETLQKFYGISKEDTQGVLSAFVEGGVDITHLELGKIDKDITSVNKNIITQSLALDKMLNIAGGTSAKRMTDLMRDYGMGLSEANESLTKLVFAGKNSGLGTEQFMSNVMGAADALKEFGFSVDEVIDMSVKLQDMYEKIGVPKQFAGREAALGMKQLASGLISLSDDWKALVGEKMGYGKGLVAKQKFMEATSRIAEGKEGGEEELYNIAGAITSVALQQGGGDEVRARDFMDRMGLGFKGAQAAFALGMEKLKGRPLSSKDTDQKRNLKILKDSFITEKQKKNQSELMMSQWMKGMSLVGSGILGAVMDLTAYVIAGFRTLIGTMVNLSQGNLKAQEGLMKKWDEFNAVSDKNTDKIVRGIELMGDAAKKFGFDAFGDSLKAAMKVPTGFGGTGAIWKRDGGSPSSASPKTMVQLVTVPVPVGSVETGSKFGFGGDAPSGMGKDWVGGGISLKVDSITQKGDIIFGLSGNCPRCGLAFGEGGGYDFNTAGGQTALGGYDIPEKYSDVQGVGKHSALDVYALGRVLQREAGGYKPGKLQEDHMRSIAWTALNRQRASGGKKSITDITTGGAGWGKQGDKRAYATTDEIKDRKTLDFARKFLADPGKDPTRGAQSFFHATPGKGLGKSQGYVPDYALGGVGGITKTLRIGGKHFATVKSGAQDAPEGRALRGTLKSAFGQTSKKDDMNYEPGKVQPRKEVSKKPEEARPVKSGDANYVPGFGGFGMTMGK